jgi:hypothetical protein
MQASSVKVAGGRCSRSAWVVAVAALAGPLSAQDLAPRAYVITPTNSHAIILSSSFNSGAVLVDPTAPVDDGKGSFQVLSLGYYQSLNFLGRSANLNIVLPYARGNFEGKIDDSPLQAYRSGLADARVRFSVNLNGGRAMRLDDYMKWTEKRLIGVSLTVSVPTGQYDPARLANTGTNRFGFKPELGMSRKWRRLAMDWYFGAWLFTGNRKYYPGTSSRTQTAITSIEAHLGYYLRPRLWASLDANFWNGSRSTVNGVEKADGQRNSRIGGTLSIPVNPHHAVKFSYSQGAYVTIGGAFRTLSAAWQYSWITPPR